MRQETVIVLDFGGQYNQLIARRVRECGVYCEVKPYTTPISELRSIAPIGLILTGGPGSVYAADAPKADPAIFELGIPVLGICYGCQLMAHNLGGSVIPAQDDTAREYGRTDTFFDTGCALFDGLPAEGVTWMSHGDYMERVPDGFKITAHTAVCPNAAIADEGRGFYGVQFHPEVNHTEHGTDIIRNFLYRVCGAAGGWSMGYLQGRADGEHPRKSGRRKGAARSLRRRGLLRRGRAAERGRAGRLTASSSTTASCARTRRRRWRRSSPTGTEFRVRRRARPLPRRLAGVTDPERKRANRRGVRPRLRGRGARDEARRSYLAQGTIYPDVWSAARATRRS